MSNAVELLHLYVLVCGHVLGIVEKRPTIMYHITYRMLELTFNYFVIFVFRAA